MKFNKKVIIYGLLGFVACYLYFHDYIVKQIVTAEIYRREDELIRIPAKYKGHNTTMHVYGENRGFFSVNMNYIELYLEGFDFIGIILPKIKKSEIKNMSLARTLIFDNGRKPNYKKALIFSFYLLSENSKFKESHKNAIFKYNGESYLVLTNGMPFALDMRIFEIMMPRI